MEDNQKIYLDKVVEFLVRDTKIDYDKDEIQSPYSSYRPFISELISLFNTIPSFSKSTFPSFSKYCKSVYGLTEDEVKYVWNQYKDIILDKITNK